MPVEHPIHPRPDVRHLGRGPRVAPVQRVSSRPRLRRIASWSNATSGRGPRRGLPHRRRAAAWSAAAATRRARHPQAGPARRRRRRRDRRRARAPAAPWRRRAPTGSGSPCAPSRTTPRRSPHAPRRPRSGPSRGRRRRSCRGGAEVARAPAAPATGVRRVCHGRRVARGRARAREGVDARRHPVAEGRQPADGPAERHRVRRAAATARTASCTPASQPAARSPSVVGSACCTSVRADHRDAAVRTREGGERPRHRREVRLDGAPSRVRATSFSAVSRMSCDVAPKCTHSRAAAGPPPGQRHQRDHRVAARTAASASSPVSTLEGPRPRRARRRRRRGPSPVGASAL